MSLMQAFLPIALQSVPDPRGAAQRLMGMGIPQTALWPALAVVVLVSTVVSGGLNMLSPASGPLAAMMASPFISALVTFSALVFTVFGLHWTGRMFGGQGQLSDMLLVMTWFQGLLFVAQIGLILMVLALPPLGALMFLAFFAAAMWMSIGFVDAVHGFDSYFKALGTIVFAFLAIGFGLSIMLAMIGVGAEGITGNV